MEKKVYVELPPFTGRNVPITEIAAAMHKDAQYVRIGLQQGILKFGYAIKLENSNEYNYYCPDRKAVSYTHLDVYKRQGWPRSRVPKEASGSVTLHPSHEACGVPPLRWAKEAGPDHAFRKRLPVNMGRKQVRVSGSGRPETSDCPAE